MKLDGVALVAGKLVRFAHGGGGFFAKLQDVPLPDVGAHALAVGDFDDDGIDDVAVLGRDLLLFHGGGLGAWPAPEAFAVIDNVPYGTLAALDLDADDRSDLATGGGAVASGLGYGLVQCWRSGSPATSVAYGAGKPGAAGVPTLETLSPPVLGEASGLRLGSGLPGAAPLLFVGLEPIAVPFDAGTLLVAPLLVLALPPYPGSGVLDVPFTLPSAPMLAGTAACFQAMFVDLAANGPYHTAQSRGLSWTFGD